MPGGETKCCAACRTRKARQARPDLRSMRATRSYQPVTRYIMFDSAMPMAGPDDGPRGAEPGHRHSRATVEPHSSQAHPPPHPGPARSPRGDASACPCAARES